MTTTIITVRIPKELKEKCEKLGINIGEVVRRALENEVRRREEEILKEAAEKLSELLSRIDRETIVRLIREDRKR